jgi:hypothetical protein
MNTWISSTIVEEDFDYSSLVNVLSGDYVADDIETRTTDENGEEVIEYTPHPHAGLTAPDFSGKLVFAHFTDDYTNYDGVDHIVIDEFKATKAWNDGVAYAKANGATHVVIMNQVTHINPHVIKLAIDENPDVSVINISDGGVFIVNTAFDFAANEDYNFWFEDNNILNRAAQADSYARPAVEEPQIKQLEIKTRLAEFDIAIKADFATNGTEIPNLDGFELNS